MTIDEYNAHLREGAELEGSDDELAEAWSENAALAVHDPELAGLYAEMMRVALKVGAHCKAKLESLK